MKRNYLKKIMYGWNYFFEKSEKGKIRVGRHYTNGHVNSKHNVSNWFDGEEPKNETDLKKMVEDRFYKEGRN